MADQTLKTTDQEQRTPRQEMPQSPGRERRSRSRLPLIVVAVLLLAAGIYYYQHGVAVEQAAKTKAASAPRGIPVTAVAAHLGDIGVYVEALGTVTPVYTVTVTSRVQGEIMKIYYREGQIVRKGDPLIDIDSRPFEAALTQAEGQLAHDQAVLKEAQIDLERYQAAYNRNAIAQQQVVDQEQLVKQSEGTVKNDQGIVENAKVNLIYCHIKSPIDGRVGLRLVDPGNIIQANSTTSLVVITQLQPITVIFNVAEDYLDQIQDQLRQGHAMTVQAFNRSNEKKVADGKLLTIDNQVDTTTGTVKLRAIFENKDNSLFPNQFVNARLLVTTQHGAILIPTAAVQRNAQGAFVYVIKPDNTASMVPVKPGTIDGNTEAVQGIQENQIVAVTGFDKLQDGIKVTVRTGKGGDAAASSSSGEVAP
jgi:membrane fusion protein, multidrug efflux system